LGCPDADALDSAWFGATPAMDLFHHACCAEHAEFERIPPSGIQTNDGQQSTFVRHVNVLSDHTWWWAAMASQFTSNFTAGKPGAGLAMIRCRRVALTVDDIECIIYSHRAGWRIPPIGSQQSQPSESCSRPRYTFHHFGTRSGQFSESQRASHAVRPAAAQNGDFMPIFM